MTSCICDIPYEIMSEYIALNFLFKDVKNLNEIYIFNTRDMIDAFIKKDPIFENFSETFNINIYDTVKKSSIKMTTFDEIISNFRNNVNLHESIDFDMNNLNIDKIYNTISILKLFKKYSTKSSHDSTIILSRNLVKYMSDSFLLQNKTINDVSVDEFIEVLQHNSWDDIGINLYDFFKKCQFAKFKPRSYDLKSNIQNNLIDKIQYSEDSVLFVTINLFMKLVVEFDEVRTKLYIIYELYRYLNYIEENDISFRVHSKEKLKIAGKFKAQEFMYQLQYEYATELPKYLSILVEKQLSDYIKI